MNPRLTTVSTDKHGRRNTNNARQKKYRLKKAGHVEESCPICSESGRMYRCPKFDTVTVAAAAVKAAMKEFDRQYDRQYAFLREKDYGTAARAFKRAMMEFHPDKGGDPEDAKQIIVAWDKYKKSNGWEGPAPTVTQPKTVKLWGISMTQERYHAGVARDKVKVARQSARWAKKRAEREATVTEAV